MHHPRNECVQRHTILLLVPTQFTFVLTQLFIIVFIIAMYLKQLSKSSVLRYLCMYIVGHFFVTARFHPCERWDAMECPCSLDCVSVQMMWWMISLGLLVWKALHSHPLMTLAWVLVCIASCTYWSLWFFLHGNLVCVCVTLYGMLYVIDWMLFLLCSVMTHADLLLFNCGFLKKALCWRCSDILPVFLSFV